MIVGRSVLGWLLVAGIMASASGCGQAKFGARELIEQAAKRVTGPEDLAKLGSSRWAKGSLRPFRADTDLLAAAEQERNNIVQSVPDDVWERLGEDGVQAVCDVVWLAIVQPEEIDAAIWERAFARLPSPPAVTAQELSDTFERLWEARESGDPAKVLGQALVCQGVTPEMPTSPPTWISTTSSR